MFISDSVDVCVCVCVQANHVCLFKSCRPPGKIMSGFGQTLSSEQNEAQECWNLKGHAAGGLYLSQLHSTSSSLSSSVIPCLLLTLSAGSFLCLHSPLYCDYYQASSLFCRFSDIFFCKTTQCVLPLIQHFHFFPELQGCLFFPSTWYLIVFTWCCSRSHILIIQLGYNKK